MLSCTSPSRSFWSCLKQPWKEISMHFLLAINWLSFQISSFTSWTHQSCSRCIPISGNCIHEQSSEAQDCLWSIPKYLELNVSVWVLMDPSLHLLITVNGSTCTYFKYWPFPGELYQFPSGIFSLFRFKNTTHREFHNTFLSENWCSHYTCINLRNDSFRTIIHKR